jgi:enoyl-CoA hydratase/carnithine racemase
MTRLRRERLDAGIEVLRLDRPEARNALDSVALAALAQALDALAADDGLRALVVSTTDARALCAGADLAEALDDDGALARMAAFARVYAAVEAFPAPTIAVCVGHVVGAGAELAAGCDLRVAGDTLRMRWAGASMGAPVGPARLVPLAGLAVAKDLVLTGRVVQAPEALALGLVHRLVPAAEAEATALALAREVAAHDPAGVRALKALFAELGGGGERTARENAALLAWQRAGGRLAPR